MSGADDNYPVDEIARAWLVKMRGDDASRLREEFEAWLAASPDHCTSYDRIASAMDQSAILKESRQHGQARADVQPRPSRRRWFPLGASLAAATLVVAIGANMWRATGSGGGLIAASAAESMITRKGEIRTFRLADGTTATLDTDSRLEFVNTHNARHLRLTRGLGRINFDDGSTPFILEVGDSVISGSRAELDIGIVDGGAIVIRVLRGSAQMGSRAATGAADTILPRPEVLRYRLAGGRLGRGHLQPRELPSADWPTGWSEHRSIQLAALAREANRYAVRPIVIDDETTGRLEVSGRFQINRPEGLANRLGQLFDLSVEKRADGIYLRPR